MEPDFSTYDAAKLRQVLGTIDAARFPDRVDAIHARLAMLEQAAAGAAPVADNPAVDRSLDLPILKRTGAVLMIVGALDVAAMIYFVSTGRSYSSSLNIFALIAGIFIWRGGMRASSIVRWIAWASLPGLALMLIASFAVPPLELTLTTMRLYPASFLESTILMVGYGALLIWVVRQLGRAPVLAARVAAGRKLRDMRIPLALGIVGMLVGVGVMVHLLGSERASRAEMMAAARLGAGYHYFTQSLNVRSTGSETAVSASVAAWNKDTVLNVPVEWRE